jgi:HK97 family phage portal protein
MRQALNRLLGRNTETRAADPSWQALTGLNTTTGLLQTPHGAESLSAVLAATNAISTAVASLPAYVQRFDAGRLENEPSHPLQRLIELGPNPWQGWADFIEFMVSQTLLHGNSIAEIRTDARGAVSELRPIPWQWVSVQLLPSGRLAFDVTEHEALYGGTGSQRRLLQGEVLHLADRSDEGLLGKSRLSRAREVIEAGQKVQRFSRAIYENGVAPSGVIQAEGKLPDDQIRRLKEMFTQAFAGAGNAGSAMILDQNLKWQQLGISPEDAELLASRRFSVEEVARLFQVPPPLVQDYSHNTFTNSVQAGRWFATLTLQPWITKLEQAFKRQVFSESSRRTHRISFDMSAFMRGDPEQRWAAHKIAIDAGVLDADEVREIEGYAPRGGE